MCYLGNVRERPTDGCLRIEGRVSSTVGPTANSPTAGRGVLPDPAGRTNRMESESRYNSLPHAMNLQGELS